MPTKSKIQDQTFLFTGTLTEFTRDEAEALVEANVGKVLSGVSAKLNYLVVGDDAGSKLAKAKALKTVSIITEKEFLKMVPKEKTAASKKTATEKTKPVVTKASTKKVASETTIEEVKIGNQIWMAKNLDVAHFRNGDPIPEAKTDKEWMNAAKKKQPAYCNGLFGKLYNWYAVEDSRGLSPECWYIPSSIEWDELVDFFGGKKKAAKEMRVSITWKLSKMSSLEIVEKFKIEQSKTKNSNRFSGLPGCYRNHDGLIFGEEKGFWWTSTELDSSNADARSISYLDDMLYRPFSSKAFGYSVRCIKSSTDTKPLLEVAILGGEEVLRAELKKKEDKKIVLNIPKAVAKKGAVSKDFVVAKSQNIKNLSDADFEEVEIGNQIWMAKNLDLTHFRNGEEINRALSLEEFENYGRKMLPAYIIYENKDSNRKKFGLLYNFHAVKSNNMLAPTGYRIPSTDDWNKLISNFNSYTEFIEAMVSKIGDSNMSLKVLFGGGSYYEQFEGLNKAATFWTCSEWDANKPRTPAREAFYQSFGDSSGLTDRNTRDFTCGFSVRCIREDSI